MKSITIREYGKIYASDSLEEKKQPNIISQALLKKLQAFDGKQAKSNSEFIFDWSNPNFAKAKSYVGFIQIPGLQIEILPKVDNKNSDENAQSRENLFYMLSISKKIPIKERELANFNFKKYNLPEVLIMIFISNLTQELHRGIERSYVGREGILFFIKGKLLINEQIKYNSVNKARFYLRYDELIEDNQLNRILKATAHQLLFLTRSSELQTKLRNVIQLLDNVKVIDIQQQDFDKIQYNRNSQRYEPLIDFCKLVFSGISPIFKRGKIRTYSLLFPMEKLFEEFIARYIYKYASELGIERNVIHIQARGRRKWLLRDNSNNQGKFQLIPDILFKFDRNDAYLIIDTKWKVISEAGKIESNKVATSDIYQLYAYANRYNCQDNVLLYPQTNETHKKEFKIEESENKKIRIEFIDVSRNIRKNKLDFMADLSEIIASNM